VTQTPPPVIDAQKNSSHPRRAARDTRSGGPPGPATILIVDDLPGNRRFLATLLRDQGHRVLEASNGREGLAAVLAEHPDLVITDVLMPVMDGHEFVRELRLDPHTGRIPVLFFTAPYSEREARELSRSAGVSFVLTKPADSVEVLKIVSRVLTANRKASCRRYPRRSRRRATARTCGCVRRAFPSGPPT